MRGDILRQQWNVSGCQSVFLRLLRRDPDQRRVAALLQFTGELCDLPGVQPDEAFALLPLAEIAPEVEIPGIGMVGKLAAGMAVDGIEALP